MRKIDISELVDHLENLTPKMVDQVKDAVYRGAIRSLPMLVKESPVDTGQYASSWDVQRDNKSVGIVNFAPHAPVIEYGARPGFRPPIGPLLAWAKRVLQDGVTPANPNNPADYSKRVRALAFGVQNKIFKEGIKPRHVLEKAIDKIVANIKNEIQNAK